MSINTVFSTKITDTGVEPITMDQAKLHASIDYSDYDSLIPIYISAARIAVEKATGLALVDKTVNQTVQLKANVPFTFSYSPVKQFSYAVYEPNQIGPNSWINGQFPTNYGSNDEIMTVEQDGIYEIEYKAGFTTVPNDLKLAVLQMFAFIFNHRGEYQEGRLEMSLEAERIILDVRRFAI